MNNLSDNILGLYENFCLDKQEQSSNILSNENNTYNNSELISLVYKHLVKDYNIEIFENDPQLAFPMIAKKNNVTDKHFKEIQNNRDNSKSLNKKYDWNSKEFC